MKDFKKSGFTIEYTEGESGWDCYISKGQYSASYTVAEGFGELEADDGGTLPVPNKVLKAALEHARANGIDIT